MIDTAITPPRPGADERLWLDWANGMAVSACLGLECTRIDVGRASFVMAASPWPLNPNGAVHGGLVLAAADHCFGAVTVRSISGDRLPVTATLTSEFHLPNLAPLAFDAQVDRIGRSLAFVRVAVYDAEGRLTTKVNGAMAVGALARPSGMDVEGSPHRT
ncbi:PaaI family thioesterase [Rhodococcus sp. JVH1]|uniref:PaaI family thioesterase n=1 Tax=Rhodococcus sp. JVH1 TaxID=745408 RepID=UPI000271FE15|nr:PaaI family thioesterase [Rhodococcus sp. JVH1]EJI98226.1 hypothetical protein JVH1_4092 [Rhodococcus sp. JVH1]